MQGKAAGNNVASAIKAPQICRLQWCRSKSFIYIYIHIAGESRDIVELYIPDNCTPYRQNVNGALCNAGSKDNEKLTYKCPLGTRILINNRIIQML